MQAGNLDSNSKLNLFTKVVFAIMLLVLTFFPFGAAAARIAMGFSGYWDMFTLSIMAIAVGLCLAFCIVAMLSADKRMSKCKAICTCIALYTFSMTVRMLSSYLLQAQPVSDFNTGYQYAIGNLRDASALGLFPYLGAYALTLRAVFKLFPANVLTAQVFNAAMLSFIPVFLFLGIRKILKNDRPAIASAMLYAVYPPIVTYSSILSCENISQVFVALFLLIHAYWMNTDQSIKKKLALSVVMGVCLGFLNLYKPIMPVFIGAIVMACFCYELIPAIKPFFHKESNAGKVMAQNIVEIIIVIVIAYFVYNAMVASIQIKVLGYRISDGGHSLGSLLYTGLNPQTNGVWSAEVIDTISEARKLYPDVSEENRYLLGQLVQLYQGDVSLVWKVQLNKLYADWCQEAVYYYWTSPADPVVQGTVVGSFLFENLSGIFAVALYSLCTIGLIIMLVQLLLNWKQTPVNCPSMFVCIGVVFLFVLTLMLIETQGRYKSNIMPLVCCISGIGMWLSIEFIVGAFFKFKRMILKKSKPYMHDRIIGGV